MSPHVSLDVIDFIMAQRIGFRGICTVAREMTTFINNKEAVALRADPNTPLPILMQGINAL